jgi:hypothetical protein
LSQQPAGLSVIIPAHQGWHTVLGTLESLRRQTVPPDEIVVAMDRVEQAGEIPPEFQDHQPPVIPVSGLKWLGPGGTRNTGLQATSAGLILFLDSSVVASENLVETHLEAFRDDAVIAAASPTVFHEGEHKVAWFYRYSIFLLSFALPGRGTDMLWTPTANLSYRRSAVPELVFEERLPQRGACEDVCFGHTLVQQGKLACVKESRIQHEYWYPLRGALRKFTRWGRGEAQLTQLVLDGEQNAPLDTRRLNDVHLLVLVVLALLATWMFGTRELALLILLVSALHMLRKAAASIYRRGVKSWASQWASWLQLMCYFSGSFGEAVRLGDPRLLVKTVRIYNPGILPPPRGWLNRLVSIAFYFAIAVPLVHLLT